MSGPSTADEFLDLTARSGLVEPPQLQDFLRRRRDAGSLPESAPALADALVHDGLLTRFHVEQLLAGKWRHFVLGGKYKVLGPLGSGGMGQVYLCEHQVMRRRVAVKVLPDRSGDPAALARFRREARAVAQLKHPNIVGGHDIDQDGELHFLVMEYIDGNTLYTIVKRRGPMDPVRAAHYVSQAALGLQHAHEAGLVHRDVKPSNLVLDRAGTVKVLDLGLARFFHDASDDLSRRHAESPVGTLDYMAPEQARDSHAVDVRADVYSLGATFYFLLAGRGPFSGMAPLQKGVGRPPDRPPPIRELRPEVPEAMGAVIERMMAPEPAERYPTPAAVARALEPWTGTPIPPPPPDEMPELLAPAVPAFLYAPAREASRAAPAGSQRPTVRQPDATDNPAPPPPEPAGRRRALALLAGFVVLGAVAVALVVYGLSAPDPAVPPVAAPPLRLLVPAYFYPAGDGLAQWDRLIDSPAAADMVIVANPASGPGDAANADYTRVLGRAKNKGVTVIGYVTTSYARRPLQEVKGDVDQWIRLYPGIRGIFLDEQASSAEKVFYYAALYEYVRKDRGLSLVVTNPGTECAEEYFKLPVADVACMIETSKDFGAYRRPAWAANYPPERFAAFLSKIGSAEQMRQAVAHMREQGIGYGFVTDAGGDNPWCGLPPYWDDEVRAVQQEGINHR
jgi:serine/threonine protein kinase